jgi:type II secretory pathway pseudopilin PulG
MQARHGFTLIEALLAASTLALLAAGTAVLYASGQRALAVQSDEILLSSALRSGIENAVATPFDQLTDSTTDVAVGARLLTRSVAIAPADVDGDGTNDVDAVLITVSLDGRSVSLLRVADQDRLGKH